MIARYLVCLYAVFNYLNLIARYLMAQSFQQLRTGDALWKTGKVIGVGNQERAAIAGIHHHYSSTKTREVDRRRQTRGTATYDQAVNHRIFSRGMNLALQQKLPRWRTSLSKGAITGRFIHFPDVHAAMILELWATLFGMMWRCCRLSGYRKLNGGEFTAPRGESRLLKFTAVRSTKENNSIEKLHECGRRYVPSIM